MFQHGLRIGPYTLIRELGRGAFGAVWLAEQRTSFVTTNVAAKLPLSDDLDLDAFRQEAQVWVRAGGHPNVLPLITADIFCGQVLIASQFAPEGTLSDWLKQHDGRAPTVRAAIQIIIGILKGLKHLHLKEIVHRDLKPANVLIQGEEPLIADFGLARVLRSESSTLRLAGTPAYMAPEIWKSNDRCFQADLWAVGIIFYEMIAGRRPFSGTNHDELERAILQRTAAPLPDGVPQEVRRVVDKAIEKDKNSRFQSAGEMLEALASLPSAEHFAFSAAGIPETAPYLPTSEIEKVSRDHVHVDSAADEFKNLERKLLLDHNVVLGKDRSLDLIDATLDRNIREIVKLCRSCVTKVRVFSSSCRDRHIELLKEFQGLEELELSLCPRLTDESFLHISKIGSLKTLDIVSLRSKNVTVVGFLQLRRLPNIELIRFPPMWGDGNVFARGREADAIMVKLREALPNAVIK